MGGRQYEISSMPVTDVIEMVAGILTKITTNNDAQHEPLHKYLTPHESSREAPPPAPASPSPPPPCMAGGNGNGGDPASQCQTPPPLDPQSSSVLAFHGRNIPSISILSYLSRIHRYCPTTYEVFLSLLVYFDRMSAKVNGPLMQRILKREKEQERAKRREERLMARNKAGRRSSMRQGEGLDSQQEQLHNYPDTAHAQAAAAHGSAAAPDPSHPPLMSSRYLSNPHLRSGPVHDPSSPFSTGTTEPDYEGQGHSTTNREGGDREFSRSLTEDSSFAFPPMLSSSVDSVTESDSESSSSSDGDSWGEDNEFTETVFDGLDERIALSRTFVIDSYNVHRLVIAGVTCASKFFSDVFYTNSRYAKVGGLPLSELNHLELQFLFLNDFRLSVTIEELEAYGTMLVEFYASEVLSQQRAREQKQRESLMRAQAQFSKSPYLNNNNNNNHDNNNNSHFSSADYNHHHQAGADMHYSPANANHRPAQEGAGYHGHGHGMGSAEEERRASGGSASPESEVCMRSAAADRGRERERAAAAAAAAARHQQDHA
ncbi:hypothetical protein KEM56_003304 [Ascosphaera pollenicola]|nr:hypothetical protein KEM56_003304 [Ascosphaera pollenicola]